MLPWQLTLVTVWAAGGRTRPQAGRELSLWFQLPEGGEKKRLKSPRSKQQLKRQRRERTVLGVGVEGRKLWLRLRDDLLPVHALLQSLEHALLSDSLNVPSEDSKARGAQFASAHKPNPGRGVPIGAPWGRL